MPAAILISSVPVSVSREEYAQIAAQNLSHFLDVPPVLQLKEEDVSVILDPPLDG
jgi:nucleotide-sensitive chloride channel 1A